MESSARARKVENKELRICLLNICNICNNDAFPIFCQYEHPMPYTNQTMNIITVCGKYENFNILVYELE